MSTKTFTWGAAETGVTTATGYSNAITIPGANIYKAIVASLGAAGTSATMTVEASIDGGLNYVLTVDTLTLTGASAVDEYHGDTAFNTYRLNVSAITGTLTAKMRYIHS